MARKSFSTRKLEQLVRQTAQSLSDELDSMDPKEKIQLITAILPFIAVKQGTLKPKNKEEAEAKQDPLAALMN